MSAGPSQVPKRDQERRQSDSSDSMNSEDMDIDVLRNYADKLYGAEQKILMDEQAVQVYQEYFSTGNQPARLNEADFTWVHDAYGVLKDVNDSKHENLKDFFQKVIAVEERAREEDYQPIERWETISEFISGAKYPPRGLRLELLDYYFDRCDNFAFTDLDKNTQEDLACPICLEDKDNFIKDSKEVLFLRTQCCQRIFHRECFEDYYSANREANSCPNCRKQFTTEFLLGPCPEEPPEPLETPWWINAFREVYRGFV